MHPNLSFEQAPPLSVPYRFFLTAPWFGVAGGLVVAALGADALASRWTPGVLAATHLLVAGFMLQAMCGALLQFMAVAAGANVWRPKFVARIVHPLLAAAAVALPAAFLTGIAALFLTAAVLFGIAVTLYVAAAGMALWRTPGTGPTLLALRLAVFALAVTVALGITLATAIGYGLGLPLIEITHVHAAWGLGGWALILLMGVSYYVVPMFQLTPAYPQKLSWALPPSLILILTLWSRQAGGVVAPWQQAVFFAGILLAAAYAATTLILQSRRRRKVPDATLMFFRGAMICLLAIAASSLWFVYDTELGKGPLAPVWLGILAIPGVFVSAISGMLYKIVPFLNWLHLQRIGGLGTPPPNMREMLSEPAMFRQMRLHFAALALLLLAVPLPILARPAGLLFAASCAWLGINLWGGVRSYRRFRDRIRADAACRGS